MAETQSVALFHVTTGGNQKVNTEMECCSLGFFVIFFFFFFKV